MRTFIPSRDEQEVLPVDDGSVAKPQWVDFAHGINGIVYIISGWFLLPALISYLTGIGLLTSRLYLIVILAGWFFLFSYYVPYRLDYWAAQPDERPGLFRYSAQVSRTSMLQIVCFLILSSLIVEYSGVWTGPGYTGSVLKKGDFLFSTSVTYMVNAPARGEIVVFAANGDRFTRRIVGLPRETVEIVAGEVRINGNTLDEPYIGSGVAQTKYYIRRQLAPDEYLILSDDRSQIEEKVIFVRREDIAGKAFLRVRPVRRFGLLPNVKYSLSGSTGN